MFWTKIFEKNSLINFKTSSFFPTRSSSNFSSIFNVLKIPVATRKYSPSWTIPKTGRKLTAPGTRHQPRRGGAALLSVSLLSLAFHWSSTPHQRKGQISPKISSAPRSQVLLRSESFFPFLRVSQCSLKIPVLHSRSIISISLHSPLPIFGDFITELVLSLPLAWWLQCLS